MVVGWLDAVGVGEGPECGPAVEEVLGELAVVLRPRAFPGGVLEQPAELLLERRGLCLRPGTVGVGLVAGPGGEELARDAQALLAELLLFGHAFAVGGEVSEQMRPAERPLGRIEVVVAAPAIGADDPGEALAEQRPGLEGVAAGSDPEDRGSGGQGAPERAVAAGGLPAGLVDVDDRRRFELLLEPGVGQDRKTHV